ncbi:MAG: nucleoside deaminase [Chitinophagaceae bacterium]|nr:nucleoside deaminase [Chitinophagaceae bacterium]
MDREAKFMNRAIELSRKGMSENQGGPFGCVIVKGDKIIGEGFNQVTATNDPTAHAEIVAIRNACANLSHFQLDGCELYTSCEPCPMCMGAIYWARPEKVYYANTRADAEAIGFDDSMIYQEFELPADQRKIILTCIGRDAAQLVFKEWQAKGNRTLY